MEKEHLKLNHKINCGTGCSTGAIGDPTVIHATIKFRIFHFVTTTVWGVVKHIAIDALLLGVVLLWLRSKKDRRFEGAIRVLLGDAVAQVQKLGDRQLGKIQLPKLVVGNGKKS